MSNLQHKKIQLVLIRIVPHGAEHPLHLYPVDGARFVDVEHGERGLQLLPPLQSRLHQWVVQVGEAVLGQQGDAGAAVVQAAGGDLSWGIGFVLVFNIIDLNYA